MAKLVAELGIKDDQFQKQIKDAIKSTEELLKKGNDSSAFDKVTTKMRDNMSKAGGDIRRELKAMQKAAVALESQWRSMSDAEKASASGQAFRQHIDQIVKEAGRLKDVQADIQGAIKFKASDTAQLDAVVGGMKAITAAAEVAGGALTMFGVSEENVQAVQQRLVSIMAVANGLQTIQNALQKESALMLGIAAAKQKILAATTALHTKMIQGQTTAQIALNVATKAAPWAAAAAAIAAVVLVVRKLMNAEDNLSESEKREAEQRKLNNELAHEAATKAAEESAKLSTLYSISQDHNRSLDERKRAVKALQDMWPDTFSHLSTEAILAGEASDAYNDLASSILNAAMAEAAFDKIKKNMEEMLQLEQDIKASRNKQNEYNKQGANNGNGMRHYGGSGVMGVGNYSTDNSAAAGYRMEKENERRLTKRQKELQSENDFLKSKVTTSTAAKSNVTSSMNKLRGNHGGGGGGSTKNTAASYVEGSVGWLDQEISKLEAKIKNETSPSIIADLQSQIDELQFKKDKLLGNIDLKGIIADGGLNLSAPITDSIKGITGIKDHYQLAQEAQQKFIDGISQAQEGLNSVGSMMSSFSSLLGENGGAWITYAANVIGAVSKALPAIAKLIPALAAKSAGEAMSENSSAGPLGWIAGIAAMLSIIAAFATLPKFAKGGIVGGTSYSGDNLTARVNSGEMVLNRGQQTRLFSMLNGGGIGGGEVEFRISGSSLKGVLNNYSKKMSKV